MSEHVLLNYYTSRGKVIKCEACRAFYHFFRNEFKHMFKHILFHLTITSTL